MEAANAEKTADVAVVGGGVIGVCCALSLAREGLDVVVVEREPSGMGAVAASCWLLAPGEILPLSRPGILRNAPGWLLNPNGPLSIRAAAAFSVLPWFLRFAANAAPRRMNKIADALSTLTRRARADWRSLLNSLGFPEVVGEAPVLAVFNNRARFAEAQRHELPFMTERGFEVSVLHEEELFATEPALSRDFCGALEMRDWRNITDPAHFMDGLTAAAGKAGVRRLCDAAKSFEQKGKTVRAVRCAGGKTVRAKQFILAAGAQTKPLAKQLGVFLPIAAAAGYRTELRKPGASLRRAMNWVEGGFGVAPSPGGIAVAGTVEFCGLRSSPNFRRAKVIVNKAQKMLPGLRTENGAMQNGVRPLCPDTLPIIGRLPGADNVVVASGHGQLGLTLAATTARLVADIIAGREPDVALAPFSPQRFQ